MVENIQAQVGTSTKPDGRQAGKEAAEKSVQGLDKELKFALVFSSIHYEQEFEEMLEEIKNKIDAPVIGCTGSGIISSEGLFVKGVGVLAVGADQMTVVKAQGHGVKAFHEKIGKEVGNQLMEKASEQQKYENEYIFMFTSGVLLDSGPGKEEYLMDGLVESTGKDIPIIGGSAVDDMKLKRNYQFMDHQVLENSVVALYISSPEKIGLGSAHGLQKTEEKVKITNTVGPVAKTVATEIDGKPAWKALKETYGIPDEMEEEFKKKPFETIPVFGALAQEKGGQLSPHLPAMIAGDSVLFLKRIKDKELCVCKASGKQLLEAAKDAGRQAVEDIEEPSFGISISCVAREQEIGDHIDKEQEYIKQELGDIPFLGFYSAGEHLHRPGKTTIFGNDVINIAVVGK